MNTQVTHHPSIQVTLTAHRDDRGGLLLANLVVPPASETHMRDAGSRVAVVIDRSGSMDGPKLALAVQSVARLIRSLGPEDRLAVIAYDDAVTVVSGLTAPSAHLAKAVEAIRSGGCTNLYDGWLTGAKIVGEGGRVILLSDGLANMGRYQSAHHLGEQARISYQRFGVTTSTIGIGNDYDEALMAGMARMGGGSHYYCHSPESVMNAFSEERFSIGSIALSHVTLRVGSTTVDLGHLWHGETKKSVLELDSLEGRAASLRFTAAGTGIRQTISLEMPAQFGKCDEATFEKLLAKAADVLDTAVHVRSQSAAGDAGRRLRDVLLEIMAHPLADSDLGLVVRQQLQASIDKLNDLERHYDEPAASMHRKSSLQMSTNMRERAKSYSSFEEQRDYSAMMASAALAQGPAEPLVADPTLLALRPIEDWRRWMAVPVREQSGTIYLAVENPKDFFELQSVKEALKRTVRPVLRFYTREQIEEALSIPVSRP